MNIMVKKIGLFGGFLFLLLSVVSCDKFESTKTITGVWRCKEYYQGGEGYRSYYVSVESYSQIDTNSFVILNMYNLGYDFETIVQRKNDVFTILGSSDVSFAISGKGTFDPVSYTIDWTYSVSGSGISDPVVSALFEKP